MTITTESLEGRVTFETEHFSLGALAEINAVEQKIRELEPGLIAEYPGLPMEVAYMLVLTRKITFNFEGNENPMLTDFQTFWTAYNKIRSNGKDSLEKRVRMALEWRLTAGVPVVSAWNRAVNDAQMPWHNPVQLPESALTPAEREELRDEDSPLAISVEPIGSPGESGQMSTSDPSET